MGWLIILNSVEYIDNDPIESYNGDEIYRGSSNNQQDIWNAITEATKNKIGLVIIDRSSVTAYKFERGTDLVNSLKFILLNAEAIYAGEVKPGIIPEEVRIYLSERFQKHTLKSHNG